MRAAMFPRLSTIVFVVCLASVSLADDFETTNGKEYRNVTVSRQEPDGIFITNAKAGVMVKLYFAELPKEVQERFGYKREVRSPFQSDKTISKWCFFCRQNFLF